MLATLVLSSLLGAVPAASVAWPVAQGPDPAIRLTLGEGGSYVPGRWAQVHVRAARDGYLLEADIPLSVAAAARLWDHFTR